MTLLPAHRPVEKTRAIGPFSPVTLGVVLLVLTLLGAFLLFERERIATWLRPGETIEVHFAQNYRLRPLDSEVKIAGVPLGIVESVDRAEDGTAVVQVKIDSDAAKKLGDSPGAAIRPTTLLGGKYYVELIPGGGHESVATVIPVERTTLPVELQQVASALQPDAIKGLRSSTRQIDATLHNGGQQAIQQLLAGAPDTFVPASEMLRGLQGTDPKTDLPQLVRGLESTARVLNQKEADLGDTVQNIATTFGTLNNRRVDVARFLGDLPATLESTDDGLQKVDGTLGKLRETAGPARDIARQLDSTLKHLDPVLKKSRPVIADLRQVVADARPLMDDLIPTTHEATSALNDIRGPVLDRVNGPIMKLVVSPYKGTGPYAGSGSNKPFFEELAYMFTTLDRASMTQDGNGVGVRLQPGIGGPTPQGTSINFEQLLGAIGHMSGGTPEQRGAGK
jgi:phospholipid/cholesterol/gamma-HCH transport system substrate-binding protein